MNTKKIRQRQCQDGRQAFPEGAEKGVENGLEALTGSGGAAGAMRPAPLGCLIADAQGS